MSYKEFFRESGRDRMYPERPRCARTHEESRSHSLFLSLARLFFAPNKRLELTTFQYTRSNLVTQHARPRASPASRASVNGLTNVIVLVSAVLVSSVPRTLINPDFPTSFDQAFGPHERRRSKNTEPSASSRAHRARTVRDMATRPVRALSEPRSAGARRPGRQPIAVAVETPVTPSRCKGMGERQKTHREKDAPTWILVAHKPKICGRFSQVLISGVLSTPKSRK